MRGRVLQTGLLFLAGAAWAGNDPQPPKDLGLVERTERTLVQLIVRIRALDPQYRSQAAHLTKEDFSVQLDLSKIPPQKFELDNFCPEPEKGGPQQRPEAESSKHLLFFVNYMEPEGLANTNAMIRSMIPRMAAEGYQMAILPIAGRTNPVLDWTGDVDRLLGEVERLFDPSTPLPEESNESSENRIRVLLESNQVDEALVVAREEELAAQLTFEGPRLQLERAISELADLPLPKAVVYFADSGYFFRESIVELAIRSGVAIYAVKADGTAPYIPNVKLAVDPGAIVSSSLISLSEHTGGRFSLGHFRKNASDTIMNRVLTDLSCVYVLSLDASALERELSLRPRVKLRSGFNGRLSAETIPNFTIPSDKRRQEEAASIALRSARWPGVEPANVSIVPLGFDRSRVNALIQLDLDSDSGAPSIPTAWDVGINYSGEAHVSGYGNLRITSRSPKIVFERTVALPFGRYWIVGTAQEVDGHGLARGTVVGAFKRPTGKTVEFPHPVEVMQKGSGTFVREKGKVRAEGWSSLRYAMASSDRPISFEVSLCRGKDIHGPLTIEQSLLLPDNELRFSSTEWPHEDHTPCVVLNNALLEADRLPWLNQPYEALFVVKVRNASGEPLAKATSSFWIVGPGR